jgi:molecular chaperone GrpE
VSDPDGTAPEDVTPEEQPEPGPEPAEETSPAGDGAEDAAAGEEPDPLTAAQEALADRTLDLQRLQAEYVNYKRRVDRDRDLVRQQGEIAVLQSLLTVLDDIGRAGEHGELEGGFKSVAEALQGAVTKHRLEAFGAKGEAFDPSLHEAVFHAGESGDVDVTTVDTVMRTGYRVGERVLRAATVGVVDPASDAAPAAEDAEASDDTENE